MSSNALHQEHSSLLYPRTPYQSLRDSFFGKHIQDLAAPAVILDLALVKKHCRQMLETARILGASFRAHVKTHKTAELSKFQVGESLSSPARFIASTISEIEGLHPLLQEFKAQGRPVNVLYGIAPSSTCFNRLGRIRAELGPESVAFMIDHPAQLKSVAEHFTDGLTPVYIKTDSGYGRAGLTPGSRSLVRLLECAVSLKASVNVLGFYTHLGSSYSAGAPDEALDYLSTELQEALNATQIALTAGFPAQKRFTISVGATPTAVSTQNLIHDKFSSPAADRAKYLVNKVKESHELELHAGVYPVLDLQQLATHARPLLSDVAPTMTSADIGIRVLAEVLSVYTERSRPEALIGAGTIALGREPCKSYPGWAIVAPSPWDVAEHQIFDPEADRTGWIVGRVAQEHGILAWEGDAAKVRPLQVGEKLLLWPNHACIACSNFRWCIIVDSSRGAQKATEVVDVWQRWQGW